MSYGLEIYDTDGVTKVVSDNIGVLHVLAKETLNIAGPSNFFSIYYPPAVAAGVGYLDNSQLIEFDTSGAIEKIIYVHTSSVSGTFNIGDIVTHQDGSTAIVTFFGDSSYPTKKQLRIDKFSISGSFTQGDDNITSSSGGSATIDFISGTEITNVDLFIDGLRALALMEETAGTTDGFYTSELTQSGFLVTMPDNVSVSPTSLNGYSNTRLNQYAMVGKRAFVLRRQ
tara:strand:+ start:629 stop:1309 length:681 start_codon:yes stop_codon:yes gene_type:complete